MSKTTKWVLGLVVLAVVVGVVAVVNNKQTNTETLGTIKIGIAAAMTGDYAFVGESVRNGAQMAVNEVNADPKNRFEYQLVVEDDGFDIAKTASAVNKFIGVDKVIAFMTMGSGGGNVGTPIAEREQVIHMGMASDPNVAKGEFSFTHWTQPEQEVEVFVRELARRNLSKVALISVNQQGYKAITDEFKKEIEGTDIRVVYETTFNPGLSDFKTIIARAEQAQPDVIYLGTFDPETTILATQLREMGVTTPLTSIESFGLVADPSVLEGQWFVDSVVPTGSFLSGYRDVYGIEPGPAAGNAYDIVKLLAIAVEDVADEGQQPEPATVAAALHTISRYSGALGPLEIDSDGVITSEPSVKVIKNGKAIIE